MFQKQERRYIETARIGRLATADTEGRPHAVPVCFAFVDDHIVTPIDEKPQRVSPDALRRSRDISDNPYVALIVDHYTEGWSQLGWVQVRGTASHWTPDTESHLAGVRALREKYDQYADHNLEERPLIRIAPGSVRSWGQLERPDQAPRSDN
ncbi:MAG: TIGR03668 family PPOX class F420-dependent oxidoreductase [Natronomonas sp.]